MRSPFRSFKDNLGGAEQLLDETARSVTSRNIAEMEEKLGDIKHQAIQDVFKSAEWYEKKAQTHIQNVTEKAVEQAGSQLREKAGELSSAFTSELDNSSRNFVGHTQSQMEDTVRDAFERARTLFAEASDTTAAAFTDEVQRTGRHELEGFGEELQKSWSKLALNWTQRNGSCHRKLPRNRQSFCGASRRLWTRPWSPA